MSEQKFRPRAYQPGRHRAWLGPLMGLLLLGGCASAPEINHAVDRLKPATADEMRARRDLLVGTWFGEALTNEGQTRRWLRQHQADGTYRLTVRDYNLDGSYIQQVEVGQWGISGPIYFTIMKGWQEGQRLKPINPNNPYYYDAFEILNLSQERWSYQHKETQARFNVRRVADDFQLPGRDQKPSAKQPAPAVKKQPAPSAKKSAPATKK